MECWGNMPEMLYKAKKRLFLGIDTSNYTTSVAVFDAENGQVIQKKLPLPVKSGELGLRQSDAVFHHINQISNAFDQIFPIGAELHGIGVSTRPRNLEGSYMPCFRVGEAIARILSRVKGVPIFETSHQAGHILAALYSSNRMDLIQKEFLAFHVSGGTTDCLLVMGDSSEVIQVSQISGSLDVKAGQLIDRVGVMLGMKFPCGAELEILAQKSVKDFKIKPTLKNLDCCLSGVENKCNKMLLDGDRPWDIAKYCIQYITITISEMTAIALEKYGNMPIVYAGGVMSNNYIKNYIQKRYDSYFAPSEFSCDNAVGTAIFAALKGE